MPFPQSEYSPSFLLQQSARCVACGLCLPHCPTYRNTLNEADSPRGRIALMAGLLEGRLEPTERLLSHLDGCLVCRACEAVCPNQVAYGQLIGAVRGMIEPARRRPPWRRAVRWLLLDGVATSRAGLSLAGRLLRCWQGSLLQGWARRRGALGRLGRLEAKLPVVAPVRKWREVYPANGEPRGEVGLFLGCVARVFDVETLEAAIFVLNRLGYTVRAPRDQGCCGALHGSQGEPEKAAVLARQNVRAFAGLGPDAVIFTATGCGSALKEYRQTLGSEGAALADQVADISAFLVRAKGWEEVAIVPLNETVAVHDPCTMRNVLRAQQAPYELLGRIPGARVIALAGNDQCCGGAGAYTLTQPEMAGALLHDKIAAIRASGARILATSNIGCAAHLVAGIRTAGLDVEVVHPVTLVARQMGFRLTLSAL